MAIAIVRIKGANKRGEADRKIQRAIDLLEEKVEAWTRENGVHPSECGGVTTAKLTVWKVIGK